MWEQLFIAVVASLISYALAPKNKASQPTPQSLDDFEPPMAELGGPIPIVFGTRWLTNVNCTWFGDLETIPIQK